MSETIFTKYTYRQWYLLISLHPGTWTRKIDKDYFLKVIGNPPIELPYLRDREWKKIVPVPATVKWIAVSYPERTGNYDVIDVLVFEPCNLNHKRSLTALAVRDGSYAGFLAFSRTRLAIVYRTDMGYEQYNILEDRIISSPPHWWPNEKWETLMWSPGDNPIYHK